MYNKCITPSSDEYKVLLAEINSSAVNRTIALNDSIANYKRLEIVTTRETCIFNSANASSFTCNMSYTSLDTAVSSNVGRIWNTISFTFNGNSLILSKNYRSFWYPNYTKILDDSLDTFTSNILYIYGYTN